MPRFITDIDGTIWQNGQPVERVIDYIEANSEEVIVLTNRPETERSKTEQDLRECGLSYERLIMNDTGEPAPAFKSGVVSKLLDDGLRVDLFIDNDPDNRKAVSSLGVKVMDPADIPEEDDMEAKAIDRLSKIKTSMSKITPEAEVAELRTVALALTAERDDLRATVEKLTVGAADELTAAKADIVTKEALIADLNGKLEAAAKETETLKAALADMEASKVTASKQAADIVASTGVEPAKMEQPVAAPSKSVEEIRAEYAAMAPSAARIAFLNANRSAILFGRLK